MSSLPRFRSVGIRPLHADGFTLIEVVLAVAVVAIGIVGILGLLPLGLQTTREASDKSQMATIAQQFISYYQQDALDPNSTNSLTVIPWSSPTNTIVTLDDVHQYAAIVSVQTNAYPQIWDTNPPPTTSMVTRVMIQVYRVAISGTITNSSSSTNTFFTEVARYVHP